MYLRKEETTEFKYVLTLSEDEIRKIREEVYTIHRQTNIPNEDMITLYKLAILVGTCINRD